jgi:hypothetical protein
MWLLAGIGPLQRPAWIVVPKELVGKVRETAVAPRDGERLLAQLRRLDLHDGSLAQVRGKGRGKATGQRPAKPTQTLEMASSRRSFDTDIRLTARPAPRRCSSSPWLPKGMPSSLPMRGMSRKPRAWRRHIIARRRSNSGSTSGGRAEPDFPPCLTAPRPLLPPPAGPARMAC